MQLSGNKLHSFWRFMNIECSRILLTSVSRELDCLTVHVSRDSRVSGFAGSVQHKCLKALFPYQSLQGLHQESVLPASCVRVGGGHPLRLLPGKNQRLAPNTFYSTHQVEQLSRCFYTDVLKCKGFLNSPDIMCPRTLSISTSDILYSRSWKSFP